MLFSLSKKFNLFYVEHKHYIGGRYSVLSEVGLLPLFNEYRYPQAKIKNSNLCKSKRKTISKG